MTKAYVDNMLVAAGSGNVIGPDASVASNVAAYDGTTGKVIKDSGVPASSSVRNDIAQGLTIAQQVQARKNIYAAPLDAHSPSTACK